MERLVAGFTWLPHLWAYKVIHALLSLQLHGRLGVTRPLGAMWSLRKTHWHEQSLPALEPVGTLPCDLSLVGMEERQHQVAEIGSFYLRPPCLLSGLRAPRQPPQPSSSQCQLALVKGIGACYSQWRKVVRCKMAMVFWPWGYCVPGSAVFAEGTN